jgi:predicted transcriptional regulator
MKVVFKPSQPGLAKIVGSAERPILEVLWEKGPLTGREIYEQVRKGKALAYTTVLTLVSRMVKKGSVRRRKVDGLYAYEAALKKAEFEKHVASAVIKGILEVSPSCAVSSFVDIVSKWDESKLDEIMEIIEEKRKAERR